MATTYISVIVTNSQGKAKSGVRVSTLSQQATTDSNGQATISTVSGSVAIFVDGKEVYDGFTSACPNPLICMV